MSHEHYFRDVSGLDKIDVYRILDLFGVTCPIAQHVVKKALVAGQRGHKSNRRDWQDIADSAGRKLQMLDEDMEALKRAGLFGGSGVHALADTMATNCAEKPMEAAQNADSAAATNYGDPTLLPDGSAFAVMSFPLPADHWLYAPRQYADGAIEPRELPRPIMSHDEHSEAITAAVRYAIRGATNCGADPDFDPDALVLNAVYALCGPFSGRPDESIRQDAEARMGNPGIPNYLIGGSYSGQGGVMIQCPGCTAQSCECRP